MTNKKKVSSDGKTPSVLRLLMLIGAEMQIVGYEKFATGNSNNAKSESCARHRLQNAAVQNPILIGEEYDQEKTH